jgi:hypothetical protein
MADRVTCQNVYRHIWIGSAGGYYKKKSRVSGRKTSCRPRLNSASAEDGEVWKNCERS